MKLSIIIPVFNEKDTVKSVIDAVEKSYTLGLDKEIILIDDFSTDGTRNLLKNLKIGNLKILYNEKNLGKGASVRKGLGVASGSKPKVILNTIKDMIKLRLNLL